MRDEGRQGCYAEAWFSIRADSTRSETTDNTDAKNKKRSPGWVRILAQPRQPRAYQTIPRDYVSGCKLNAATNPINFYANGLLPMCRAATPPVRF